MKIIFLDFDGVLNRDDDWGKNDTDWGDGIYACHVAVLNQIVERSDAKVVLSTSWRKVFDLEELTKLLGELGFVGEVVGMTPLVDFLDRPPGGPKRGYEIQCWLDEHPEVTKFVILDDADDMDHLRNHLVLIDPLTGLVAADVERVLTCLNS